MDFMLISAKPFSSPIAGFPAGMCQTSVMPPSIITICPVM
jgi:hypothetical protein